VNVGAGHGWQHPYVIALDVDPETDVRRDVTSAGLPFPDGSMNGVYSSHCIEHMTDPDARGFLKEAYRCLGAGGLLRIVCPDMDLLFDAYDRRDVAWFDWCAVGLYARDSWLRGIGRVGASLAVDGFSDEELARLYAERGRRGFMEALYSGTPPLPPGTEAAWPDSHKSW